MKELKADLIKTDDGYELVLFGAAFQGLKKEIVRDGEKSGIKYKFRREGFDLIAKAFSGIKTKTDAKAPETEAPAPEKAPESDLDVKPEDVHPDDAPQAEKSDKNTKKNKNNKK